MINYTNYRNVLLKGICSLGLLSMVVNGGDMDLEEIRKVTNGKGVFSVAITNNGKKYSCARVNVFVHLTNLPPGYAHLKLRARSQEGISVLIENNATEIVELPLPFLGLQEGDDIEQYDNTDNLLPLPENSEVIVEVRNASDEKEFGLGAQLWYSISHLLKSRGFNRAFKAKYLDGTRLIELPDQVRIAINYDDQVKGFYSPDEIMAVLKNS